jgi:hypothetical protein
MHELGIKAVEMVRKIREAHYALTKDLSPQERIQFFRDRARALHAEMGISEQVLDDPEPDPAAIP